MIVSAQRVAGLMRYGVLAVVLTLGLLVSHEARGFYGSISSKNFCTTEIITGLIAFAESEIYPLITVESCPCLTGDPALCVVCRTFNPALPIFWKQDCLIPVNVPPVRSPDLPVDHSCAVGGSIVDIDNRMVGETVSIVGTPFQLTYFSDRVPGRIAEYQIDIPITGASVAELYSAREVSVQVAGRTIPASFSVTPEQTYRFIWDGFDVTGQRLHGSVPATVVRRRYVGVPTEIILNWGTDLCVFESLATGYYDEDSAIYPVGTWNLLLEGLDGWNLNVHHYYDRTRTRLYLGDGTSRTVQATSIPTGYRVAAEDGTEVYLFDTGGRHTQTLHGLTG